MVKREWIQLVLLIILLGATTILYDRLKTVITEAVGKA